MDEANRKGADRYGSFDGGEDAYWLAFVREAIDRLGVSPVAPIAERALPRLREAFRAPEAWIVWPDVVPVLGTLRRFGVVLGLVSNWDSRLPDLLAALGLRTHFDAFAVSSIEGVEKPAPRLFRIALERLGVAPDEAVHVGDVPSLDADGAVSAGIDAALVDRNGRLDPTHGAMRDLNPLPRLVASGSVNGILVRTARTGS
jgi:putative hydrolase of the HAD superfamily